MKKHITILSILMAVGFSAQPAMAIPMGDFIPFGGDAVAPRNDDGSSPEIPLSSPFTYFGEVEPSLWVNNNGNITFDGPLATFTPFAFPGSREIVAPYFADVDTRPDPLGGTLYFGERLAGSADLVPISGVVNTAFDPGYVGNYAFVTTWDHVGYYLAHTDLVNTFQLVLTTDGTDSYAIFNYLDEGILEGGMTWEAGDASGGVGGFGGTEASAGFDAGNSVDFFTIAGSRAPGIAELLEEGSNIRVPGQWVFQINEGTILPPPPSGVVPEPSSLLLLGSGVVGALMKRRKVNV